MSEAPRFSAARSLPAPGFRRLSQAAGLALCAAVLVGCVATGSGGGKPASFVGGTISVVPPAGYCVDRAASSDSKSGAVILIGECGGTSGVVPAIISISVGEEGSSEVLKSGAKALSDYFTSPAGRAALARDGAASSVVVRSTALSGGAMVMKMFDRQVGEYWRAVLGLKGRLVSISVMAPETSSLSPDQSRALLEKTMTALRAANGSVARKPAG